MFVTTVQVMFQDVPILRIVGEGFTNVALDRVGRLSATAGNVLPEGIELCAGVWHHLTASPLLARGGVAE